MARDTTNELQIEAVTKFKPASDAYTSNTPKNYGGGARLIRVSVAKVKWLDRPEVVLPEKGKRK